MLSDVLNDYVIDASPTRDKVMQFLNEIGLLARYEAGATGFSEGCRIDRGTLVVDLECRISTLLHEAGCAGPLHRAASPDIERSTHQGRIVRRIRMETGSRVLVASRVRAAEGLTVRAVRGFSTSGRLQ
jgi:hypothetical protein